MDASLPTIATVVGVVITGMTAMCVLLGRFLTLSIRAEISKMRDEIRTDMEAERLRMDSKYISADLAAARLSPVGEMIAHVSKRLDELEQYSHTRNHKFAQDMTGWLGDMAHVGHKCELNGELISALNGRVDRLEMRVIK